MPPQYYHHIGHAVEYNNQHICTAITLLHIYTFLLDNLKKINVHLILIYMDISLKQSISLYVPHSVLSDAHFH